MGFPPVNCSLFSISPEHGAITTNEVALLNSAFMDNPPIFTLHGNTSGGPPTTYIWKRNGEVIRDGSSYSISIRVNDVFMIMPNTRTREVNQQSRYLSTLMVTGNLPGVYQYSVGNRATDSMIVDSFDIEGIIVYTPLCITPL